MQAGSIVGGKYRLTRVIGEGAMGSVWAAVHELLGREVAIKFHAVAFEDEGTSAARFVAEAKAAAQVKHRFVVDVFDFGIDADGNSYMVQELLAGEPLSDVMVNGPVWSLGDALRFMTECLSGLSAVHERGVVHRDLKPENIFVVRDSDGRYPKLLDFGISKAAEAPPPTRGVPRPSIRTPSKKRLTAAGATLGTPAYMSPEQLRNLSTLDARADIYSLGVVFYEWLVGHCPFASTMNYAELLDRILLRAMTPLHVLRPDLGPALCAVVAKAIEPDRDKRFASALEMRSALIKVGGVPANVQTVVQRAPSLSPPSGTLSLPPMHSFVPTPSLAPFSLVQPQIPAPGRLPVFSLPAPSNGAILLEGDAMGDSLRPMGLRKGPSARFWLLGATLACAAALAVPMAMKGRADRAAAPSRAAERAVVAPPAVLHSVRPQPAAALPAAPTAPAEAELPYGELPPDAEVVPEPVVPTARKRSPIAPTSASTVLVPKPIAAPLPALPAVPKADAPPHENFVRSLDF